MRHILQKKYFTNKFQIIKLVFRLSIGNLFLELNFPVTVVPCQQFNYKINK